MHEERIRKFIRTAFFVTNPGDDDASLTEEGVVDSTGMMEVIQSAGKEFGIAVRDDETSNRRSDAGPGGNRERS